jgi:hypothetical protein
MPAFPHDTTDLALAPVVLAIDAQLESFAGLDQEEITLRIALETDREPRNAAQRAEAALETATRFIDLHGWEPAWTSRGLRLRHESHELTLGVPESLRTYLAGA